MKVFVSRKLPGEAISRLKRDHDVSVWAGSRPITRMELLHEVSDSDALICLLTDQVDEVLFKAAPQLRAVSNYAVGFENISVQDATKRQIAVGNTPDALTDATAEFALIMMLNLIRKVPEATHVIQSGSWPAWDPTSFVGNEFGSTTVGVIGWGRIGKRFGALAEKLGMKVIHTGEFSLEYVLRNSDVLSIHVPLTQETRGMIDKHALSIVREGCYLVNTARGPVVDSAALINALENGQLSGAALDVTDPEPLPLGHPLLNFPNVIITPHIASASHISREGMANRAVDNILASLSGSPMPYPVNVITPRVSAD